MEGGLPGCAVYDRACQSTQIVELLDNSLALAKEEPPPKCRLSLDRPRDGEVLVLGDVACELGVEVYENETWHWKAFWRAPSIWTPIPVKGMEAQLCGARPPASTGTRWRRTIGAKCHLPETRI